MADMLKFRKGTIEQISKADKVAGTIYIAKDEKAMYVDISASERIRIGDFVRVATVDKIPVPYSETAIYYVEADNALLGYKDGKWSQINGTEALITRISTAEDKIAANTKAIEDNAKAIDDVEAYVGTFSHATAKTVVEYINAKTDGIATSGNLDALAGRVTEVEGKMTAAEGDIDALEETVAGHTTKISKLETASAKHALKTELNDYAKSADVYTKAQVYTKSEADSAIETAVNAEADRAKGQEQALDSAIKAVKATAEAAVSTTAFNEFKGTNAQAIATAKSEATADANTYTDGKIASEVTRANDAYAPMSLVETVNAQAAKLNKLASDGEGSVTEAKNRADEAYDLANAAVTTEELNEAIANFTTKNDVANVKNTILGEADYDGTVKGAYEAAAAAKKAADDANELASEKTTAAEVKTQIEKYGYATTGYVDQAEADAVAAAKTAGDLAYAAKSIEETVAGHGKTLTTLTGTGAGSVTEAKKAGDDAAAALAEYQDAHKNDYTNAQIDAAVADAKKAGTDAQATANTANNQANANKAAIAKLNGSATTEGSVAKAVADAEGRLTDKIANEINAANAMDYKGGVDSEDALDKKTDVKVGDTYVATKNFTFTDGRDVYPGDLLIANGAEVNGVIAVPTWEVVHTGYDASLEQEIKTAGDKIVLLSAVGANNGEIAFVSDGSAAKVSVANNTVTIGIEWEDFK